MIDKKFIVLLTFVSVAILGMDQGPYTYKTIVCSKHQYVFQPSENMKREAEYLGLIFKEDPFVVMKFEDESPSKLPVGDLENIKFLYVPTSHIISPFGTPMRTQSQNGLFEIHTQHKINNQFLVLCYDKQTKYNVMTRIEKTNKSHLKRIKNRYAHLSNKESEDNC